MSSLKTLQVLLVDDNPHMRAITSSVLRSIGISMIWEAEDGASGIERLRERAIDLVFADLQMFPMDGLEFTRLVRTDPHSANPYLPIIMMTGHTQERRIREARDAGVTEFIAKPITGKAVVDRLNAVIIRGRPFIKTDEFFGPDRRRLGDRPGPSESRRAADQSEDDASAA